MRDEIFNGITAELTAISELLTDYSVQGGLLLTCGTDEEINKSISVRGDIIEKIKNHRAALDEAVAQCDSDEADIFRKMLSNKAYSGALSPQLSALREQTAALRSIQLAAVEKDKLAQERLSARFDDIKLKLEELQDDKKKIDFYAKSSAGGAVGGSLDSHS